MCNREREINLPAEVVLLFKLLILLGEGKKETIQLKGIKIVRAANPSINPNL